MSPKSSQSIPAVTLDRFYVILILQDEETEALRDSVARLPRKSVQVLKLEPRQSDARAGDPWTPV